MPGLRDIGRWISAGTAWRPLLLLYFLVILPALSAYVLRDHWWPHEKAQDRIVIFQTTAEQVQRARKANFIGERRAAVAEAKPDAGVAAGAATPETDAPASAAPAAEPVRRHALSRFHDALRGLETGARQQPVTVLHLGDSHIASDRFSGDIRAQFQARFGDAGRGLMMPGFPFTYYRARGVKFSKKGSWAAANSFKKSKGTYGLTGVSLTSRSKNARLTLTSETGPFEWAEVTFLTGTKNGNAVVAVDGEGEVVKTRGARGGLHRVRIEHKGKTLSISVKGNGTVTVLSWAVGNNRPGVRYVNLGIPGATADTTRRWDKELVQNEVAHLKPDLIVLGYGTNEGFNDNLNIDTYQQRYVELVGKLKEAAPNAELAIIGPADGARLPRFAKRNKSGGCNVLTEQERLGYRKLVRAKSARVARWHAPPKLSAVRTALHEVAKQSDAHYWDWAAMMGGPCGIHKWSRSKPKLALGDHVHISAEGGKKSAEAFFKALTEGLGGTGKLASRSDIDYRSGSVSH